jgi:hypothetical protein
MCKISIQTEKLKARQREGVLLNNVLLASSQHVSALRLNNNGKQELSVSRLYVGKARAQG